MKSSIFHQQKKGTSATNTWYLTNKHLRFNPTIQAQGVNHVNAGYVSALTYPLVNVNKKLWKITIFNGKIQYQWPFSIAMLVYQRVVQWGCTIWLFYGIFMGFNLTVVFCFKFCELGIYVFIPMVKIEGLGTIAFVDFKY